MAESVSGAEEVLRAGASFTFPDDFKFFIKISGDNVEVHPEVVEGGCKTVATLSALYLYYKPVRGFLNAAVKTGLGGERDDQAVGEVTPGSLRVQLHCRTEERFLEVLADYESGRMKERLQEEFSRVGINVGGLKVEIQNMVEVNETKEAINQRDLDKDVEKSDEDCVQHDENQSQMLPLPCNKKEFLEEATSLGLHEPNPNLEKPRAKLLKSIESSMKIRRSINHVSILLLGSSGVGKSTTVNHLLGVDLAKTSATESKTRSTKEFVVHGSNPKYEVEGLSLGLVDTPGFCDTDGSKQDACNLLSVKNFFTSHPNLSDCYPNLIFLLVKATDNRIVGENSDLGKSLRCIKQLGLVDPDNPNVVAILTHVCSLPKNNVENWTKALDKIKSIVTKLVFDDLKVQAPVVLIENMYEYDDWNLKHLGDYTCLPNNEWQPKNLYTACAKVLLSNKDKLGLITLNSIFVDSKKFRDHRVTPRYEIKAKDAKQCTLGIEEKAMVERFKFLAEGGCKDPFDTAILQFIDEQKLQGRELDEIMKLTAVLRCLGVGNPTNFESYSVYSIEYFLGKEISCTGLKLLKEKFKIEKKPSWDLLESGRLIGQGYNILTDKSVAAQVMNFKVTNKHGIKIPTCAKFEKVQESKSFMEVFKDEKSYTRSRLISLNTNLSINPNIFKMDNRAGYNKKSDSTSSTSHYSFLFEQRLFELKLGNYKECLNQGMTLAEDFKSDVEKLPSTYDKNNSSCVSMFERFFNRFGHFVVSSAYGGGSVEVKCSRKAVGSTKTSLAETKAYLAATLEGLDVGEVKLSADHSTSNSSKTATLLKQSTYSWEGGDVALQTNDTIGDTERMQKWKNSLILNPAMLSSELTLEPISTLVGCVDFKKDETTYEALKDLLKSDIEIRDKKENKSILDYLREFLKRLKNVFTREETVIEPNL